MTDLTSISEDTIRFVYQVQPTLEFVIYLSLETAIVATATYRVLKKHADSSLVSGLAALSFPSIGWLMSRMGARIDIGMLEVAIYLIPMALLGFAIGLFIFKAATATSREPGPALAKRAASSAMKRRMTSLTH